MGRYGLLPLSVALRNTFYAVFAVFAADSTLPFACWCPGLLVLCSICHEVKLAQFASSFDLENQLSKIACGAHSSAHVMSSKLWRCEKPVSFVLLII